MKKIVVFDVCDTLYSVNTTFSFLDFFFSKNQRYLIFRKISKLFPLKLINYFVIKLLGKDIIKIFATYFLKNFKKDEIQSFAKLFVYTILSQKINNVIFTKLKHFQNKGYYIVLMSGSYDFIIKEVANYLDVNDFFASKLKTKNKIFSGKFDKDILMSKHDLFKKNYKDFKKLIVVSNNKSDLNLMNLADQAYAVCNKKSDFKFWKNYKNIERIKGI
jgi:phosphoserine phosphatase